MAVLYPSNITYSVKGTLQGDINSIINKSGSITLRGCRGPNLSICFNFSSAVKITSFKVSGSADVNYYNDWWRQRTGISLSGINENNEAETLFPYVRRGYINRMANIATNLQKPYKQFKLNLDNWDDDGGEGVRTYSEIDLYGKKGVFLIKQDNNYYYFTNDGKLTSLGAPLDNNQKKTWFTNYGIGDLNDLLVPRTDGTKLIDQLNNKFQIRMMTGSN